MAGKRKWTEEALKSYRKYQGDFIKENYKCVSFRLRKDEDADVLEFLHDQPNIAGYIRQKVRADIKKQQKKAA